MSFDFYFFLFSLSNVLSVNTESLFKLSSGLCNIFLIATTADNDIYKVGSFTEEIWFQDKWLVSILEFKEFTLYDIIATNAAFSPFRCFESWLVSWKVWRTILRGKLEKIFRWLWNNFKHRYYKTGWPVNYT